MPPHSPTPPDASTAFPSISDLKSLASVEFAVPDLCGVLRGKRYPASEAAKVFASSLQFPVSVFGMDAAGEVSNVRGIGQGDGDPDVPLVPLSGTWERLGWRTPPSALVLCEALDPHTRAPHALSPRGILGRIAREFEAATGLRPWVSFEQEFFLFDFTPEANGAPRDSVPGVSNERPGVADTYGLLSLETGNPVMEIYEHLRASRILTGAITHEAAGGQYEINLGVRDDALRAADDVILLRYFAASIAASKKMRASFMPKPLSERVGSGLQINLSLWDGDGNNVFAAPKGDAMPRALRHSIAGLLAHAREGMLLCSPHINAFRRHAAAGNFAPNSLFWNRDDRNATVRIPQAEGKESRLEHRIAASDANPYLVLACVLSSIRLGLESGSEPPEAGAISGALPVSFPRALVEATRGGPLREAMGADYFDLYTEIKELEFSRVLAETSEREYQWYL